MKRKYWVLVLVSLLVMALDQWTKRIVTDGFRLGESVSVVNQFFNLTYVRNTGAAFGLLAQANPAFRIPFFVIIPVVALTAIAMIFKRIGEADVRLSSALSLVIGGAMGNLIDRLNLGYVVDFLDFHWKFIYHFPAFNVADTAICIGVGVLMLDLLNSDGEFAAAAVADPGTPDTKDSKLNAPSTH